MEVFGRELLIAAKTAYNNEFTPAYEDMDGCPWLLGYLANTYCGNIIASTKAKWKAVVKDSIKAYGLMHLRNVTSQTRRRVKREISRRIFSPGSNVPNNQPQLDQHAHDLIAFHRQGFLLNNDTQALNQHYINQSKGNFHYFILHFGHCLRRQENLERTWNEMHLLHDHIHLKKQMPLPIFCKQQRKSVKIDIKGLYYILSEYRKAVRLSNEYPIPNFQFENGPDFPGGQRAFCKEKSLFEEWMHYLFRINKVLGGSKKKLRPNGVAMYTNAVSASVLYIRPQDEKDNIELLQCIDKLSLVPIADDHENEELSSGIHVDNDCPMNNLDHDIWEDLNSMISQGEYIHDGTFVIISPLSTRFLKCFTQLIFLIKQSLGVVNLGGHHYEISVDPGTRNILLIQVYYNGLLVKTLRLTQDGYYDESRLNLSTKKWIK